MSWLQNYFHNRIPNSKIQLIKKDIPSPLNYLCKIQVENYRKPVYSFKIKKYEIL
jgi:hypothetical protein